MKKIFLTLIIAVSLFSCDDYLAEDASPNSPQDASVAPDKKLAAALTGLFRTQAVPLNQYGNRLTYAWGYNVNAFAGGNLDEFTYNYTTATVSGIWEGLYLNVDNFQNILNFTNANHEYDNHFAVAKLMKAQGMLYIISLYGDAPYTEAFKQLSNPTPKFDDDKEIYKNLFTLIDEARQNIAAANPNAHALGSEDVIFHGDMNKWTEYANTLELKMLLRLSNTTDAEMVTLRTARFAALNGKPFVNADVTINPGYNESTTTQYNPFFFQYGLQANTRTTSGYRANVAADYIARILNGQEQNTNVDALGVADPRRSRNFRVNAAGNVVGVKQGDVAIAAGGTAPAVITNLGRHITGISASATAAEQLTNGAGREGYFMLNAESQFLQAEAIQRGFLTGNAQAKFTAGITASFAFYSKGWGNFVATPITPAAYLAASDSKNGIGWTGSGNKLEAIMTQKWLALNSVTGIEPYFDHVRTGFPKLPLPLIATQTVRPNRLLYPNSEYSANSANVPNVGNSDLYSVNSKTPFYLQ
jgi:hypothetical protein